MNHELGDTAGIVRAHGSKGAFVSQLEDRAQQPGGPGRRRPHPSPQRRLPLGSARAVRAGTTAWNRLCSADLPDAKALRFGNKGTSRADLPQRRGVGTEGRAWARIVTGPNAGQTWELPRLGKMAFENVVACPYGRRRLVGPETTARLACTDDGRNPARSYIYVGDEAARNGNEIERAGLTNGKLYGVKVSVGGHRSS